MSWTARHGDVVFVVRRIGAFLCVRRIDVARALGTADNALQRRIDAYNTYDNHSRNAEVRRIQFDDEPWLSMPELMRYLRHNGEADGLELHLLRTLEDVSKRTRRRRKLTSAQKTFVASSQEWRCAACGRTLDHTFEVDHLDEDRTNDRADNLAAVCRACHGRKTMAHRMRHAQAGIGESARRTLDGYMRRARARRQAEGRRPCAFDRFRFSRRAAPAAAEAAEADPFRELDDA